MVRFITFWPSVGKLITGAVKQASKDLRFQVVVENSVICSCACVLCDLQKIFPCWQWINAVCTAAVAPAFMARLSNSVLLHLSTRFLTSWLLSCWPRSDIIASFMWPPLDPVCSCLGTHSCASQPVASRHLWLTHPSNIWWRHAAELN